MNGFAEEQVVFGPITYEQHLHDNLKLLNPDVLQLLWSQNNTKPLKSEQSDEEIITQLISHLLEKEKKVVVKPVLSRSISESRKIHTRHLPTLEESFQVAGEKCPQLHFLFARAHNQHSSDKEILREYVDFWHHYYQRKPKLLARLEQQIEEFVDRPDVELFQIGKTSMRKRDLPKGLHYGLSNRYQHGFTDRYSHMICLLITDNEFVDHAELEALQVEKDLHSMFESHKKFGGKRDYHQSGKVKGPESEYIFFVYLALMKL